MVRPRFHLAFLLTLAVSTIALAQRSGMDPELKRVVGRMAKLNVHEVDPFFNERESISEPVALFMRMKEVATDAELVELTRHKNAVVRVYAFEALEARGHDGLLELAVGHIHDTVKVEHIVPGFDLISGIRTRIAVAEFFVDAEGSSKDDRRTLDSILIHEPNDLSYTQRLLARLEPLPQHYDRIRELVELGPNNGAVIALAKYRKPEDRELIGRRIIEDALLESRRGFLFAIDAVEHFPDPWFKDVLTGLEELGPRYYAAVAAYRDDFSVERMTRALDRPSKNKWDREYKVKEMYKAMIKYDTSLYNDLYFRLWEEDLLINNSILTRLLAVDPERCLPLMIRSVEHAGLDDNGTLVLVDMLDHLIETHREEAIPLIAERIGDVNVHRFRYFAEAAEKVPDPRVITSLFHRLESVTNGHIYVPIVTTVLSYGDAGLNERLVETIRMNRGIDGWGAEKVQELLGRHGLSW